MIFRCYYEKLGGHVHCRIYAGSKEGALGKCGNLTMRTEEFADFKDMQRIEFIPEGRSNIRSANYDGPICHGNTEVNE